MRTHLAFTLFLSSTVGLAAIACGDEPQRPTDSDRETGDDDDDDDDDQGNNSSQADECYNNGWWDCEDYWEPDPGYWGCSGSYSDDYWDGYCDCEWYYNDWYYCY